MLTEWKTFDTMRNIMTLKQARFNANMTQAELYVKTGILQSTLSRIENGTLAPSEKEIKLIAKALKTKDIEYGLIKN